MRTIFLILLFWTFRGYSQTELPWGVNIFVEEDAFNNQYNKDQNYTGGGALTINGGFTNSNFAIVPFVRKGVEWLGVNYLVNRATNNSVPYLIGHSMSFGTSVFTPQDIGTPNVVYGDRPFASLIVLSSKELRIYRDGNANDRFAIVSEINLGCLGSNLGDWMQTNIHKNKIRKDPNNPNNRPIPLGWRNQISDGGEPTAMYKFSLQNRLVDVLWNGSPYRALQITPSSEINLGYYTNMAAGLNLRVGLISTRFWQNLSNMGVTFNLTPSAVPSGNWYRNFEIYAFASGRGRAIAYNALLEGQFKKSAYTMSGKEINHFIAEFEIGAAIRIWRLNFIYEPIAGRTSELHTSYSRTHIWGAYYFSYSIPM